LRYTTRLSNRIWTIGRLGRFERRRINFVEQVDENCIYRDPKEHGTYHKLPTAESHEKGKRKSSAYRNPPGQSQIGSRKAKHTRTVWTCNRFSEFEFSIGHKKTAKRTF
jgi:hypothetical protein